MTELGNGQAIPKGGVLLGQHQRQLSVTLTRDNAERLKILATVNKTTPHSMLEFIADQGITAGFNEILIGKTLHVLASWPSWARWK